MINQHLDVEHYASNYLVELGYPSSRRSFSKMTLQLEEFINTFDVKLVSSTDISSFRHIPLEMQSHLLIMMMLLITVKISLFSRMSIKDDQFDRSTSIERTSCIF